MRISTEGFERVEVFGFTLVWRVRQDGSVDVKDVEDGFSSVWAGNGSKDVAAEV